MHFYVFLHDVLHIRLSAGLAHVSVQGYRQLNAGCLSLKLQINRLVITPYFWNISLQQRDHSFTYSLCFPSVAILALHKNVLQADNIFHELYTDTHSDVSDNSDSESLDRDSDVSATSSRKQLRSSVIVFTSDSETSMTEEESSELENSDDKTSDMWCKTDKRNQAMSLCLEPQV